MPVVQAKDEKPKRNREDIVVYVLSVALLATLGLAALYGMRYGNVDQSVVPGDVTIERNGTTVIEMHINDDFSADIEYLGHKMFGTLQLAGAEEDTILYQLRKVSFEDGSDAENTVLFVRMPRTGLQGDLSGSWMLYYSCPSQNNVMQSEWVVAEEGGSAKVGFVTKMNAITAQRKALLDISEDWKWEKRGQTLSLTSE